MATPELVSGRRRGWTLIQKLGEGDAGEVFQVEALLDRRAAILKRPRRAAFPSDLIRQATQIEKEGRVLRGLTRLSIPSGLARIPALLDSAKEGCEFSERYFIVMSPAPGFSLMQLARLARFGGPDQTPPSLLDDMPPTQQLFAQRLAQAGKLPHLLVLRALATIIATLEALHTLPIESNAGKASGLLWNDVKPDHLFWDPVEACFTLIDWGNAQFLEVDGATRDRQYSRLTDYAQFVDAMGHFVQSEAPTLFEQLAWPHDVQIPAIYTQGVLPLKERIQTLLEDETEALRQARQEENDLLNLTNPHADDLQSLASLHQRITTLGETPDALGGEMFFRRLAYNLLQTNRLDELIALCQANAPAPGLSPKQIEVLELTARLVAQNALPQAALEAALNGEWAETLWLARQSALTAPEPPWWDELSRCLRSLETGSEPLRPAVALNRLAHALASAAQRQPEDPALADLLAQVRDQTLAHWLQAEPDPPHSHLEYSELEQSIEAARLLQPQAVLQLEAALEPARHAVQLALNAWQRKDFAAAGRAIRQAAFYDPERRRYIQAERLALSAADWLSQASAGFSGDEALQDHIARLELHGRELRSAVGPADWLDALLEAMRELRRGADPTEVLTVHPAARANLGWLLTMETRRPLLVTPGRALSLERLPASVRPPALVGLKESAVGPSGGVRLGAALDAWTPEARGSSARLFIAHLSYPNNQAVEAALKLMRPDQTDYAAPLFHEEARILSLLRDIPGVTPMLEMGFLHLDDAVLPSEEQGASAEALSGTALRYGLDTLHNFLADLDKQVQRGWLPYLAIARQNQADNLLLHVDAGHTGGRFLPILEGLVMAIQICDILEAAHARNIIYRDHKILHYYWRNSLNAVDSIDWNVAKRYPQGLTNAEVQFDLVQFGARALHYIFTGRPAPGALPMGPNRPEEIEAASASYAVQWNYDDQRLPKDIKDLLEAVLSGSFASARQLQETMLFLYKKYVTLIQ